MTAVWIRIYRAIVRFARGEAVDLRTLTPRRRLRLCAKLPRGADSSH